MAEEDGSMSVAPTTVSQTASVVPTSFVEWEDQGPVESNKIHAVYAAFTAIDEEFIGGLLHKITASQEGEYIALIICLETRGGHMALHILPLHGLGVGTGLHSKEYKVSIYARDFDTPARQATLNV